MLIKQELVEMLGVTIVDTKSASLLAEYILVVTEHNFFLAEKALRSAKDHFSLAEKAYSSAVKDALSARKALGLAKNAGLEVGKFAAERAGSLFGSGAALLSPPGASGNPGDRRGVFADTHAPTPPHHRSSSPSPGGSEQ